MVGVWVALEDIDHTRGPLMFYPGTHRLPEVLIPDMQKADADMDYAAYETFLEQVFAPGCGWTANYALLRRGQALVWAANLHHGGSPQKDRTLSRHSQVTHCFFEGSEYWTPRMSHQGQVFSRNPAIITPKARPPVGWMQKTARLLGGARNLVSRFSGNR